VSLLGCPTSVHDEIRADVQRWKNETTPTVQYIGGPLREKRAVQDGLEYALCVHCTSTIARRVDAPQPMVIDLMAELKKSLATKAGKP
jgi:hypothetical protein